MATHGCTLGFIGHRLTDPGATFRCSWVARSNVSNTTYARILYTIKNAPKLDGAGLMLWRSGEVEVQSVQKPTLSPSSSPLPGATAGQIEVEGFHLDLRVGTLPGGRLDIDALAIGQDGTFTQLPPIVLQNDSDGIDRRSSSKVVYWAFQTGSDSNTGEGFMPGPTGPVKHWSRAVELAKKAGTNLVGGATIVMLEPAVGGGGPTTVAAQTGPIEWLTVVAAPGVTWSRVNPPTSVDYWLGWPHDSVMVSGDGTGTWFRMRFVGIDWLGLGPGLQDASPDNSLNFECWSDGGRWVSRYWDGTPRVRCLEDTNTEGPFFTMFGQAAMPGGERKGRMLVTGQQRLGCGIAYGTGVDLVYDCLVQGNLGGHIYVSGYPYGRRVYHSIANTRHDYGRNTMRGWGTNQPVAPGLPDALESQDLGGGIMRILGVAGSLMFGESLADNVGSVRTRLGIAAWPGTSSSSAIGPGTPPSNAHVIVAAGTVSGGPDDGRPYVDIQHTAAVYGAAPAGAQIETVVGTRDTGPWMWFNVLVHPSFNSIDDGAVRTGPTIIRDVGVWESDNEVQTGFDNLESPLRNVLMDNVRDGGNGGNWAMGTAAWLDCLFHRMTMLGSGVSVSGTASMAGSEMVNCVFTSLPASAAAAITNGLKISHGHVLGGSIPAGATNMSSGAWLPPGGDATAPPYSMQPAAAHLGQGHPLMVNVAPWALHPSNSTKGATLPMVQPGWGDGVGTTPIVGAGAVSIALQVAGIGELETLTITGSGAVLVPLSVAGAGELGLSQITGTGVVFLPVSTDGVGVLLPVEITDPAPEAGRLSWASREGSIGLADDQAPSDTRRLVAANGLYFGDTGTVTVELEDGTTVPIDAVAGRLVRLRTMRVNATGTTASSTVRKF